MKITELSIKRPAGTIMVIMFFIVLGFFGYTKIGSDLFPEANVPFITIITQYPGAGPEEMENQVVDEIEEALSSLSGLKESRSWVYEGMAFTALEFRMGTELDAAAADVQKAMDRVMYKLPEDIEKPVVEKYDTNAEPVMTIAVSGDQTLNKIYDYARDIIKGRLETVPGAAAINIIGGLKEQVRVDIDRGKMEYYGLSVNQVTQLLKAENINVPSGNITNSSLQYDIRLIGKFKSLEDIESMPVPLASGATITLKEIARVSAGFADIDQLSRLNGKDAVILVVQKQSGASIVDTAAGLRAELEKIQQEKPSDIRIAICDDNSVFIKNSLDDTKRTLMEGVLMTGIVLFFFLREWRSLIIVMLAIPSSIMAAFMMMYFFGFTFNMLSLMGLSLCVGILVDDSIVVLENIHRHLKSGKSPFQAAVEGRGEIGMAAIAITLSDVVVFGPIAFMKGMVGQYFRQFGLTVVAATLFSLFVSFTLTPMLAAKFYKYIPGQVENLKKKKRFWILMENKIIRIGHFIIDLYRKLLLWALDNRLKLLLLISAGVIGSLCLIPKIGFEFLPQADQGKFTIEIEMSPGTVLESTDQIVRDFENRLAELPEIADIVAVTGSSTGNFMTLNTPHVASIQVNLKPKTERKITVWQEADIVRGWAEEYHGIDIKVREAQLVGLNSFEAPIMIEIRGPDTSTLQEISRQIKNAVEQTPGTMDVYLSWKEEQKPEYQIVIDRNKTSRVGLTSAEVASALRAAVAGNEASKIRVDDKDLGIWVQLDGVDRKNALDIQNITVTNRLGETFLIKQLADVIPASGPSEIRHKNRERMVSVLANYQGVSLSTLCRSFDESIEGLDIPAGYNIEYDGMIEQMDESNADLGQALILSIILVYMILVILYESFLTPFIRMLSLPAGIIGAMLSLYLTGNTLNMLSIIGIIMLDGLAAKNGTLLIDYTNTLMNGGVNLRDALLEAGTTRLRPIFMTSTTMIFGMLPTALALADGAEIKRGMGIVLIGGLLTSTVLTPVLIPVAYTLLDDMKHWIKKKLPVRAHREI